MQASKSEFSQLKPRKSQPLDDKSRRVQPEAARVPTQGAPSDAAIPVSGHAAAHGKRVRPAPLASPAHAQERADQALAAQVVQNLPRAVLEGIVVPYADLLGAKLQRVRTLLARRDGPRHAMLVGTGALEGVRAGVNIAVLNESRITCRLSRAPMFCGDGALSAPLLQDLAQFEPAVARDEGSNLVYTFDLNNEHFLIVTDASQLFPMAAVDSKAAEGEKGKRIANNRMWAQAALDGTFGTPLAAVDGSASLVILLSLKDDVLTYADFYGDMFHCKLGDDGVIIHPCASFEP